MLVIFFKFFLKHVIKFNKPLKDGLIKLMDPKMHMKKNVIRRINREKRGETEKKWLNTKYYTYNIYREIKKNL